MKLDECKEFFLSICWIDENNASLSEIEVGFMQGIISKCICIDNNNPSLTEKEPGLMQGILAKYIIIHVELMKIMLP